MNILKTIKDYLPLFLAFITFIFFLASIYFKVDVTGQKVDEVIGLLREQTKTVWDNTNRITRLEAIEGIK